ncbi:MAG TPA: DUF1859 domain-containing protein [Nitrosomonas sp.]|nr:DUF1859 domain-containing protein [Nitrosomonas sp.]
MVIPIDPALIAGAVNYTVPTTATPINLCKAPVEGAKCIPMQFKFLVSRVWRVDLSLGAPNQPLTQLACLYIDGTNLYDTVTILFPDTGYQIEVKTGDRRMMPVTMGTQSPLFYVICNDENGLAFLDTLNIFAYNIYIPSFIDDTFTTTLNYGVNDAITAVPAIARSETFTDVFSSGAVFGGVAITNNPQYNVSHTQVVINGLQLYVDVTTTATQLYRLSVKTRLSNGFKIFDIPFIGTATRQLVKVFDNTQLISTYFDDGNTDIWLFLDTVANISSMNVYVNHQYTRVSDQRQQIQV